jgi:dTDP-4-amino-4,6-dideoxygalactose transaminase
MPRTGCSTSCTSARAFSKSACDAIIEDLRRERIEAYAFCRPMHTQRHYVERNPANARGKLLVTEKLADRAVALPFHRHLERAANRIHRFHLEGRVDERRRRRRDFLKPLFTHY